MTNFGIFKSRLFIESFFISIGIVIIGFILLSFPNIELFFSQKEWLFYTIFFLPFGITLFLSISMIGYDCLFFEYHRLKALGKPLIWIYLYLLIVFIFLIMMIILAPYLGRWAI